MAFRPGQSGNPGGRPAGHIAIRTLAASLAPRAIRRLGWLIDHGKPDHVRAFAANAILDRAIGKPVQAVSIDGTQPILGVNVVIVAPDSADRAHDRSPLHPHGLTLHLPGNGHGLGPNGDSGA
jgi:hypothetical protein